MRWRFALVAIVLLVAATFPRMAMAEGPLPPHKDPASVSPGSDAASVFLFFGDVLNLTLGTEYDDAETLLAKLRLANIPEDLRFIIDRYAELLGQVNGHLDGADAELRKASALLQGGDGESARAHLDAAGTSLDEAKRDLVALRAATDTLANRVGAMAALAEDPLAEAYRRLQALLVQLDALLARYSAMLEQPSTLVETPLPQVSLYSVALSFDAPSQAYPGRDISVSGNVTSRDGPDLAQAQLRLLLDDSVLGEFTGALPFQYTATLPPDTLEGEHRLRLEFPAQGPYTASSAELPVQIARARPEVSVHAPGVAFLQRTLKVSGTVTSVFGPLQGARVALGLEDDVTTVRTDAGGNFSGSLDLPAMALFLGPRSFRVKVEPEEPWYGPVRREARVFIVNATNLGLLSISAVYVLLLAGFAWRRRRAVTLPRALETPSPRLPGPGYAAVEELREGVWVPFFAEPGSPKARIVSSYYSAAHLLGARRSVPLLPSFTLRDFLRAVGAQVKSAFAELTGLAEGALYRSREPEEGDPQRAEELSEQVRGES